MGQSPSLEQPLASGMVIDSATDREEGSTSVHRTKPRSSWWVLLSLLAIFAVLCVTTGLRCINSPKCVAVDETWECGVNLTCTAYRIPSLGTLLGDDSTGALAISALNTLVAMHLLLTINVAIMIRGYSSLALLVMPATLVALYVMLYVSLIVATWYISVIAMGCLAAWCASVTYGLYHYYRLQPGKRLFWASFNSTAVFLVAVFLYTAFSPMSYAMLPHRDVAILSVQLIMALSCVVFVVTVMFHTRPVSYSAQVSRSYVMM